MKFKLTSEFQPAGDQPEAIAELVAGLQQDEKHQVLLGVTGSGKTFTIANVIQQVQRPVLILTHNKTLVAQLYGEFRQFFPENAVEYFVSYYDYYQPEAYIPTSDTFIEKDMSINEEVEKLRLKTTSSLLSGRRDVIVVASVSCIYGMGNPVTFKESVVRLAVGDSVSINQLLHQFVNAQYARTEAEFKRSTFRVKGDTVDIFPAYADLAYRIEFFGNDIERISVIEPDTGKYIEDQEHMAVFPAHFYVSPKDESQRVIREIQDELNAQVAYFKDIGKHSEAKRLAERVNFDMEMIRELGYCSGIENYSRFLDGREPGTRPFCLLDYFPDDYLMVVDESHVTLPQISGMFGGDRSRKLNLVEYGFRLPSAMDNRPLNYEEFQSLLPQVIFVSATPGDQELDRTGGVVTEQVVRPTGLLDPIIEIRPVATQVDDLLEEIEVRVKEGDRVLVTTLTKRMAEELTTYLGRLNIKARYIHSEVDTLERVEILRDLRLGKFDVLVGVNLLREGLDLPEVSLVGILDADKEGFLRSARSLTQIAGRAARNERGKVIMYADRITNAIRQTLEETDRRRAKQEAYNKEHGITPTTVRKSTQEIFKQAAVLDVRGAQDTYSGTTAGSAVVNDPVIQYMNKDQLNKAILEAKKNMEVAAKNMDFLQAAQHRDEMYALKELFKERYE